MTQSSCTNCDGTGWVCEFHQDRPWEGWRAYGCGGAGASCPKCETGNPPDLPPGFNVAGDKDGWRSQFRPQCPNLKLRAS